MTGMVQNEWEQRYVEKDTPWDKGAPSPGLVDFLQTHSPASDRTVLVPGCGVGHDVRAFARAGWQATGCDIAPSAVQRAKDQTREAKLEVEFIQGNFLNDEPIRRFPWIFEHTLFCAIQPSMRDQYVEAVRRWLTPGGHFLSIFYLIDDVDGPPFGTTREEILERFSPHFERIKDWVPRSYPNRTNLEWMVLWRG